MLQVVESLQKIAESHGAKFHLSSPISHVRTNPAGTRTTGIYLEGSTEPIPADIVIVNADLAYAHNNLFLKDGSVPGPAPAPAIVSTSTKGDTKKELKEPKLAKDLRGKKHSCSSISFYWAMDRVVDSLKAHNIFLVRYGVELAELKFRSLRLLLKTWIS